MNLLKQASIPPIWQWTLWTVLAVVLGGMLGIAVNPAYAAIATTTDVTAVKLYRGSTIIAASDPNNARYVANFTPEACRLRKALEIEAEGPTRTSGTATYNCQVEERTTVAFAPDPTCDPPREPETQQVACPNDPTRSFTQTRAWTIAPHPTCEVAGAWLPATPSETDCPPPELAVPSGVTATTVSTSEIRVTWNVVPDALAYSLRRCIGSSCDPMAFTALRCVQGLAQSHVTLNPGITVRYQVQASRTADCTGELSQPSVPPVSATTLEDTTPPPPPPPPVACADRVCRLNWSHPGEVAAEGFRIVFGLDEGELTRVVQVGAVTTAQVTVPAAGTWYFAVIAFAGGNDSPLSNIQSQQVQ
jgi:hypothetical protein